MSQFKIPAYRFNRFVSCKFCGVYRLIQPPEACGFLGSPNRISTGHSFGQALVPRPERREQFLLPPWQFCRGGRPDVSTVL